MLSLHPTVYAELLGRRIERHDVACWLINTGWIGGPPGLGQRIEIGVSRALLRAALDGSLTGVPVRREENFGFDVPTSCPGVAPERLDPRSAWRDAAAYDAAAHALARRFRDRFRSFAERVGADVAAAGPALTAGPGTRPPR